eukprot:TRINITY_DN39_c0_g1_i1.p1 TRINITY_DN39_c0_g1~~TRINITY_DN39_c0_g1_i1.p1  ORF type:complete len:414 (-),score=101.51 TRINITY_DN39_c0_g1_i1:510-1751(-)
MASATCAFSAVRLSSSVPFCTSGTSKHAGANGSVSSLTCGRPNVNVVSLKAGARKEAIFESSFTRTSLHGLFMDGGESSQVLMASWRDVSASASAQGGALVVGMSIFDRIVRIAKSYANAAVAAAEDPEKILEQAVLEMNEDLVKLRQTTAQVLGTSKQMENKYKQAQQNADDWYKRAKLAMEKGDEMLAKEALKRRKGFEDSAQNLKAQVDQQKEVVDKLVANTRLLESKLVEAKSKKDTLKARAQSAKTSQKVSEMLGNISTTSSLAAFERMEEKVLQLEAQSDASNELVNDDLTSKFAMLEAGSDVDDDLASLKRDMRMGTSASAGELPSNRTPEAVSSGYSVQNLAIDNELNELRRRTMEEAEAVRRGANFEASETRRRTAESLEEVRRKTQEELDAAWRKTREEFNKY